MSFVRSLLASSSSLLALSTFTAFTAIPACSSATVPNDDTMESSSEIIGGVNAQSASLDAVGIFLLTPSVALRPSVSSAHSGASATTVDAMSPDLSRISAKPLGDIDISQRSRATIAGIPFYSWCTGTLLAPTVVLTAEHCTAIPSGYDVYFAIGANFAPKQFVRVLTLKAETSIAGGPIGLGADVAVAHLDAPITDVRYFTLDSLKPSDVGARFGAIGYGSQTSDGAEGTRRAGSITLKGLEGNQIDLAYGSFDAWLERIPELYGIPRESLTSAEAVAQLRLRYEQSLLLKGYEAFLGVDKGDAQPCHGDSGGPLVASGHRVVGVTSWGSWSNGSTMCKDGVVYASIGPAVTAFVQNELADVCSGVTNEGLCRGQQAIRCTRANEGDRRLTRTDCETFGQTCGFDETGAAACVDPVN
jgi:hypothetical protein